MIIQRALNMFNRTLLNLWWLLSLPLQFTGFFSAQNHQYPDNEAGVLMRQQMAHQSSLDGLSHWWFKKSFFSKTLFFLGSTLASAWIGLLVGATTLFVLTTGLILTASHSLLRSHEEHRIASAELLAKKTLVLNEELKSCKDQMGKALVETQAATEKVNQLSDAVTIQIERLDTQTKAIKQHNEPLAEAVSTTITETAALIKQERLVSTHLGAMSFDLNDFDQAITQSKAKITTASESFKKWSAIVEATLKNQEKLSQATRRFCLFVNDETHPKTPLPTTTNDDYIRQRTAENDADELLIASWRPMLMI